MVKPFFSKAAAFTAVAILAACTSGQVGQPLPSSPVSISANTLQFAVGTARVGIAGNPVSALGGPTGTTYGTGTNLVATYRQPNGLSGTLVNSPTVTGPAGWTIPAGDNSFTDTQGMAAPWGSGTDAGTTSMNSFPQGRPTTPPTANTFGLTGGVFQYGFAPLNSNNQVLNGVNFNAYQLPFFLAASPNSTQFGTGAMAYESIFDTTSGFAGGQTIAYVGGFPAYAPGGVNFRNGTFPAGFLGYNEGFIDLPITPVAGNYTLTLVVPTSATSFLTVSKTATLPAAPPVLGNTVITGVTRNADNGATVALTVPAGATETVVNFTDVSSGACHAPFSAPFIYSVKITGTGPQTATLPGNTGPILPSGTQTTAFCGTGVANGDRIIVTAVAADYPLYEAGPPQTSTASPTIVGSGGTADISTAIPWYFRF